MRNIPGWPSAADSVEPIARVVHGGKDREFHELTLTRELPSSFHAQVKGIGGITQADGSVEWAAEQDVVESYPTALTRQGDWPPRTRDRVDVYTGVRTASGDLLAKQLTGHIAGGSGDPLEGYGSELVDPIARLTRKVSSPPLLNNMPPLTEGGPWRGVGLYPTYFTDLAARAGNFFSTPPRSSGCVFSAPLMGSAWPEQGTLVTGLRFTDRNNANAIWQEVPWGMAVSDAFLQYNPTSSPALDRAMEITAMRSGGASDGYVSAVWGGSFVKLNFAGTLVRALVTADGASQPTVAQMTVPEDGVFSLRVVPSGGTLNMTLRAHTGQEASGSIARPGSMTGAMTRVEIASSSSSMKVGGAQVSFPPTEWGPVNYARSAFITPAAHNASLQASPPIMQQTARSLLEEQSKAELAALWIDGDGSLQWKNRNRLLGGSSSLTLTGRDNLTSLPWEEDFAGVASVVEVVARRPEAILQSKVPRHEVWQSSYGSVDADGSEVFEELLHPDADEDWIMVDGTFNNDFNATNRLEGSDVALYHFFSSGTKGQAGYTTQEGYVREWATATLTRIDWRTYKLVTRVFSVGAGGYERSEYSLKIPSERQGPAPGNWPAGLGGMSFPVIRAFAKVMWADATYTADAGTWDAPVLTHDVGWWVQDPGACQTIANLLAANTNTPRPYLLSMPIVPDARLQLGDIVTLSDPEVTGRQFLCLLAGISDTLGEGGVWSQSCTLRLLSTTVL